MKDIDDLEQSLRVIAEWTWCCVLCVSEHCLLRGFPTVLKHSIEDIFSKIKHNSKLNSISNLLRKIYIWKFWCYFDVSLLRHCKMNMLQCLENVSDMFQKINYKTDLRQSWNIALRIFLVDLNIIQNLISTLKSL